MLGLHSRFGDTLLGIIVEYLLPHSAVVKGVNGKGRIDHSHDIADEREVMSREREKVRGLNETLREKGQHKWPRLTKVS